MASYPKCAGCGGPNDFDTSVPSVLWNDVVRRAGLPDLLCASCIIKAFVRARVSFTAELFGSGFSGEAIEVRVNEQAATAAAKVTDENNVLRSALLEIGEIARRAHETACRPNHRRSVELKSGGWLTVCGSFNITKLVGAERILLNAIADAIQAYEKTALESHSSQETEVST